MFISSLSSVKPSPMASESLKDALCLARILVPDLVVSYLTVYSSRLRFFSCLIAQYL